MTHWVGRCGCVIVVWQAIVGRNNLWKETSRMNDWITKDGIYLRPVAAERIHPKMSTTKGNPELTPKEIIEQRKEALAKERKDKTANGGETARAGRVNNIQIEGILHEPRFNATPNGKSVFGGRLDVSQGTNKDGTWKQNMVFWLEMWLNEDEESPDENITAFAEATGIEDKTRVVAEGKLKLDAYNDKNGQQRTAWKIVLTRLTETNGKK